MEQYPVSAYYALLLPNVCVLPRIVNEYCLCMMTYCLFIAFLRTCAIQRQSLCETSSEIRAGYVSKLGNAALDPARGSAHVGGPGMLAQRKEA